MSEKTAAEITAEALIELRKPFPEEMIETLPKPTVRNATKGKCHFCGGRHGLPAVHLSYAGHATITDRLLSVDPFWAWEPVATEEDGRPKFDRAENGQPIGLWGKRTILGITRLAYGSCDLGKGEPEKELIGDMIRNGAMRFGVGLDLWKKSPDRPDYRVNAQGHLEGQSPKNGSGKLITTECVGCGSVTALQVSEIKKSPRDLPEKGIKAEGKVFDCKECGWMPLKEVPAQA